jgi:2OG-Fe(II) oxygenase superfamily
MTKLAKKRSVETHKVCIVENTVVTVDQFLKPAHCSAILQEQSHEQWFPSELFYQNSNSGGQEVGRQCELRASALSGKVTTALLADVEKRLFEMFGIKQANLEPWQLVRYRRGDRFDYHNDFGEKSKDPAGYRRHSILVVIEEPKKGGVTHFRALRKAIRPMVGRLLVWRNLLADGKCNHAMIHSGRTVWQGKKTILVTWEHQRAYNSNTRR